MTFYIGFLYLLLSFQFSIQKLCLFFMKCIYAQYISCICELSAIIRLTTVTFCFSLALLLLLLQKNNSGNAIGFRISSLKKLVNTKSNVPRMTLLHHLVEETENKNKDSLMFVDDMLDLLQKASRYLHIYQYRQIYHTNVHSVNNPIQYNSMSIEMQTPMQTSL